MTRDPTRQFVYAVDAGQNRVVSLVNTALLVCLLASAIPVKAQQPGWSATGSLGTGRVGHTATLLVNGKVLVAGGSGAGAILNSSELYDPATGQWSTTGSLRSPRVNAIAVRLANGKVLVAGGSDLHGNKLTTILNSAEIYDPDTGTWSATGNFITARIGPSATLLPNSKVLVVGGETPSLGTAELYDPSTGTWSSTGNLSTGRTGTATLLQNGKVLVAGGGSPYVRNTAELYDPSIGTWSSTGNLSTGRWYAHTATLLPNGMVLVAAGSVGGDDVLESAELYNPVTGQWTETGDLSTDRAGHSATLLPNGMVVVAGGFDYDYISLNSSELYDPATERWSYTRSLNTARSYHSATLLANGKVLVVGGYDYLDGGSLSNTAELFDSGTPTVTSVSAASFAVGGPLAPESIAAALGANLASGTQAAPSLHLPTQLAGVSVKVRDSIAAERLAPLFFVSPGLINYQVPPGTAVGLATVTVTSGESIVAVGLVEIVGVAPGLFSANSTGSGVAAGFWIRVAAGGAQSQGYLFDLITREPGPVDLGPPSDQVFLSLYGTGFRSATGATAKVGGVSVPVYGFAPVTVYQELDVVNIGPLPRLLVGRGEVEVTLFLDGKAANPVSVNIR